jgi:uncharacterized phage protein gp47/JayE
VSANPGFQLDDRDPAAIVSQLLARRMGYAPEWQISPTDAGRALAFISARFLSAVIQRLNQAPEKKRLAFFDLLGLSLVPAQESRAPLVFQLAAGSADGQIPQGSRVAAPAPPGGNQPIVFETERATGVAGAQLKQVVTLWPGRDQYIDHSSAALAGQPFKVFNLPDLQDTPHILYIAHDVLLALAGSVSLDVKFELTQPSSQPLEILWQYFDGTVWRAFRNVQPECAGTAGQSPDGTQGLTRSGQVRLQADCAASQKTTVNGVESFWIRGLLTQPLPVDPGNALPLVETVKLSTVISNELSGTLTATTGPRAVRLLAAASSLVAVPSGVAVSSGAASGAGTGTAEIQAILTNEAGKPLANVPVVVNGLDDQSQNSTTTGPDGFFDFPIPAGAIEIQASFLKLDASTTIKQVNPDQALQLNLIWAVSGLNPDKAFADGSPLDVTKPFFPFGQQPQPGSTFYFNQNEIFTKPGARVQIYIERTGTPQDQVTGNTSTDLAHLVSWEYWNGRSWIVLMQSTAAPQKTADLDRTEIVELVIPPDMEPTAVNGQNGLWMRARLVNGGYGFTQTVSWVDARLSNPTPNTFTYVVSRPPSLTAFKMGYSWQNGPAYADRVITYNDFSYEDDTYAAKWPGVVFAPYRRMADLTPALYLGYDKPFPVDVIGLYLDVVEQRGDTLGPAMVWEYWNGGDWQDLSVDDETRNLRVPGLLSLIGPQDSRPLARFGVSLNWIRGRLKEDGPPGSPLMNGVFTNAVWASQRQTVAAEPLGQSAGLPNQVFKFTQPPILSGEQIEVQEISGPRANVEWRILTLELTADPRSLQNLEDLLSREGTQTEIVNGPIRLVRNVNKNVTEVWITWLSQPNLLLSGPDDRHYFVDRARGLLFFGDGERGKIPAAGSRVLARQYRTGGGSSGNVAARTITQLQNAIPGIQGAFNPRPAEGGADGETLAALSTRAPMTVRHRGRAIEPADYETMAHEASPAVAIARAIPTRDPSGRPLPGWITLVIMPASQSPRPWPSFGMRQEILAYIAERAPADVVAAGRIYVAGPDYLSVDVTATIAPVDLNSVGAVEKAALQALSDFLHPLRGGVDGRGWAPGASVYLSDAARVLERVEGIDYVQDLALSLDGAVQGDVVQVSPGQIVAAGSIAVKIIAAGVNA